MWRSTLAAIIAVVRVPNALTAAADVMAGFGAAGGVAARPGLALPLLMAASALLYAGGVALNDAVDAKEDAAHRPDRPIPAGAISRGAVAAIACGALASGLALAAACGGPAFTTALGLVAAILAYDLLLKRFGVAGAVALGACRFLNMGLGAALATETAFHTVTPAFAFGAYVTALGCAGFGEEGGARRQFVAAAIAAMIACAALSAIVTPHPWIALLVLLPFVAPLVLRLLDRTRAGAAAVRSVVREGVLAIPGIDAAILAGHSRWAEAVAVAGLLIGARLLARRLAVA